MLKLMMGIRILLKLPLEGKWFRRNRKGDLAIVKHSSVVNHTLSLNKSYSNSFTTQSLRDSSPQGEPLEQHLKPFQPFQPFQPF